VVFTTYRTVLDVLRAAEQSRSRQVRFAVMRRGVAVGPRTRLGPGSVIKDCGGSDLRPWLGASLSAQLTGRPEGGMSGLVCETRKKENLRKSIRNLSRRDTHCVRWHRPLLGQGEVSKRELRERKASSITAERPIYDYPLWEV